MGLKSWETRLKSLHLNEEWEEYVISGKTRRLKTADLFQW